MITDPTDVELFAIEDSIDAYLAQENCFCDGTCHCQEKP